MKILLGLFLIAFGLLANYAQSGAVETNFEKNKSRFKLEKYAMGEDASSGYDYLVYTDKGKIVLSREIWSSLSYSTYKIEDYYFDNGRLVAVLKYNFPKKYYNAAKRGAKIPLQLIERLSFTDAKLSAWTENGKAVSTTDDRWQTMEQDLLSGASDRLERYREFKKTGY